MSGLISKLFRKTPVPVVRAYPIDTDHLDASMNLLRATTLEVSEAAVKAAQVLGDRLQASEYRFFSTIDAVEDFVQVKDGLGKWCTLNNFAQNLFEFHNLEFFAKTDSQIGKEHPHLAPYLQACHLSDEAAWASKKSYRCEEQMPSKGEIRYFDVIKTPIFHEDGGRKELIIIGRDVTEKRKQDRRMKACFKALNSASDPIVILDSEGKIFFSNDKFVKMCDVEHYNDITDKLLTQVIPDFPEYPEAWNVVHQNKIWEGTLHQEYAVSIMPVMNGVPDPIYYICTLKHNLCAQ